MLDKQVWKEFDVNELADKVCFKNSIVGHREVLVMTFPVFERDLVWMEDKGDCSNVYESNEVNWSVIFGELD